MKRQSYKEKIIDWVIRFLPNDDKNPNHAHFSVAEVADLIMKFEKDKLSGKFK